MSVDCGIAVGRAGVLVCRVGALAERGARRLSWPVMTAIDPLILGLLVGGALLVGVVALWRGGRFSARLGEHSIRAGTGPQIRGIQAGRDAKLQVMMLHLGRQACEDGVRRIGLAHARDIVALAFDGRLDGRIALAGTRAQPALGGQARLSDFRAEFPALALDKLHDAFLDPHQIKERIVRLAQNIDYGVADADNLITFAHWVFSS